MVTLRINDKESKRVISSWADSGSCGLFQKLTKEWDRQDILQLFALICDLPIEAVKKIKDPDIDAMVLIITKFVMQDATDFDKLPFPAVVELDGKKIIIPRNIEELTLEQNLHIKTAMSKAKDLKELISFASAVYLQPLVDGEFDYSRVQELDKQIQDETILKWYPIGFFLLSRLNNRGNFTYRDLSLKRLAQTMKEKLLPKRQWLNGLILLVICRLLTVTPKLTDSCRALL